MTFRALIAMAKAEGASDLHLEPGLPPTLRVRGNLRPAGEPVAGAMTQEWAREIIASEEWPQFELRRSVDFSRKMEGARCRFNVFYTSRGVGFAVRLLPASSPTIEALNLLPDLKNLVKHSTGLVLISGPTGCGKSTTLASLIQTINLAEARHIVTIENPIEFTFRPQRSFIRQREVGRDTPSFEQALLDSLREDPDVLMVGEMRDPETMRLTLTAAETGHLVLATVHSSNCAEALQRVVGAFPAEIQNNVAAQLADCLIGVVSQRLQFRPTLNICIPECEILMATLPIRNFIRTREFFKIMTSLETGAEFGMWTFQRYRSWIDKRANFNYAARDVEVEEDEAVATKTPVSVPTPNSPVAASPVQRPASTGSSRIEIEPTEIFERILKRPS
ncbi:MAG TPA: PilT/PilU family type 4a pilus ATPase [Verrucomicrobiae bacterium]